MSPDFLCLPETDTVADAREAIRTSQAPPDTLNVVSTSGPDGRVTGSISAVRLIKAGPGDPLAAVTRPNVAHVHADWDLGATVRKMSDFNATVAPVMDAAHRTMLRVVTVDVVLETLMPSG
jgi:Mg/Co/Ni transporter MgtE